MGKKIVITGSYNASIFVNGKVIPEIGQTVIGDHFFVSAGGKGSNQAVAAKFQGADIIYIGKLGNDHYAEEAIEMYKAIGLYGKCIYRDDTVHTGVAVIFIDEEGHNSIMVCPGANLKLTVEEIVGPILAQKDIHIVGFQLENDVDVVCESIRRLHRAGIRTLLDPAPVASLPDSIYPCISIIKPNEHEAAMLSGVKIGSMDDAYKAGRWFLDRGVETAIITMGENGTVICTEAFRQYVKTPKVNAVDTTGAGDIFSGTLMAALAEGRGIIDAVEYASVCASLSVTKKGVYEATPTKEGVEKFIMESAAVKAVQGV